MVEEDKENKKADEENKVCQEELKSIGDGLKSFSKFQCPYCGKKQINDGTLVPNEFIKDGKNLTVDGIQFVDNIEIHIQCTKCNWKGVILTKFDCLLWKPSPYMIPNDVREGMKQFAKEVKKDAEDLRKEFREVFKNIPNRVHFNNMHERYRYTFEELCRSYKSKHITGGGVKKDEQ